MIVVNNRPFLGFVRYKAKGVSKRVGISGGSSLNLPDLLDLEQVLNYKDFRLGTFSVKKSEPTRYSEQELTHIIQDEKTVVLLKETEETPKTPIETEIILQGAIDILMGDEEGALDKAERKTEEYKQEINN